MNLMNFIGKHKNKIPAVLFIILAFIIANSIYKNQLKMVEALKEKKDTEIKKNEVLGSISQQLEKKLNPYKRILNAKDISTVVNTISNLAKESGIKINSLKPQAGRDYPAYVKYSFDLDITAPDYHYMGSFISKMESSADIYLVENMNIKTIPGQPGKGQTDKLSVELRLSTILMKD